MLKYLRESYQKTTMRVHDFYTSGGIHVYVKDAIENEDIDLEEVVAKAENHIPSHMLSEVEMIIIGWFDEFEEQEITAFYRDGALYISPAVANDESMFDDAVHEIAHSVEEMYSYEIYSDQKLKKEFLRKRRYLHDMLWAKGFKAPLALFMDPEYDEDLDAFLYKKVGYDKLCSMVEGVFLSPYAPTSLREYFAKGFEQYILDNRKELKSTCPALYSKIQDLYELED